MTAKNITLRNRVRGQVNQLLQEFFAAAITQAKAYDASYGRLLQTLRTVSLTGGKRLRPYVMVVGYEGFADRDDGAIMPIATALELLHMSMLIHDDIIDRDDIRHGEANVSGMYTTLYQPYALSANNLRHFSHAAAMLAGDFMLSNTFRLALRSTLSAESKLEAERLLGEAAQGVIGGELMDTEASFRPMGDIDPIKVALVKTAGYSFVSPLVIGATLAGADPGAIAGLRAYGEAVGLAFQLGDDLSNIFDHQATTGKISHNDLREGKKTYLIQQTLALAPESAERLTRLLGNPGVTDDDIAWAKQLIESCGARRAVQERVVAYTDQARAALQGITGMREQSRRELEDLTELVQKMSL